MCKVESIFAQSWLKCDSILFSWQRSDIPASRTYKKPFSRAKWFRVFSPSTLVPLSFGKAEKRSSHIARYLATRTNKSRIRSGLAFLFLAGFLAVTFFPNASRANTDGKVISGHCCRSLTSIKTQIVCIWLVCGRKLSRAMLSSSIKIPESYDDERPTRQKWESKSLNKKPQIWNIKIHF